MKSKEIKNKIVFITLIFLLNSNYVCFAQSESIVRIHSYKNSKTFNVGTGFIVNLNGGLYIATCYHVIAKSNPIKVFSFYGELTGISLVAYDEVKDIVLLKFDKKYNIKKGLQFEYQLVNLIQAKAITLGHPNNWQLQTFSVNVTSNDLVKTSTLIDSDNNPIFKFIANFNVITMAFPIYGGMSGSPLLINGRVVGVVSGSLNSGGSVAWAIPGNYFNSLKYISPISNLSDLPEYGALRNGQENLSKSYNISDIPKLEYYELITSIYNRIDSQYEMLDQFGKKLFEYLEKIRETYTKLVNINASTYLKSEVEILVDEYIEIFEEAQDMTDEFNIDSLPIENDFSKIWDTYQNILYELNDKAFSDVLPIVLEQEEKIELIVKGMEKTGNGVDVLPGDEALLDISELESYKKWRKYPTFQNYRSFQKQLVERFRLLEKLMPIFPTLLKQFSDFTASVKALTDLIYETRFYK